MPYDVDGTGITQEEAYRRERLAAKYARVGKIANIIALGLVIFIFLAGIIGITIGFYLLVTSEDAPLQILGVMGIITLVLAILISLFWTRLET